MKHLLTAIKHECQDYLRAWEQSNPELLEKAIRIMLCIGIGTVCGLLLGFLLSSAAMGFGWFLIVACVLMFILPE